MGKVTVGCKLPNGLFINQGGKTIELAGANSSRVVGGYGMTQVEEDIIVPWLAGHKDFKPVKMGLIFVQGNSSKAADQANEMAGVKSGFEGLDPTNPGDGLEPTDEMKKALKRGR